MPEIDDISVSSMVEEFLAEDDVEVLGNESLIAGKEDKNKEKTTQKDGDFEVDAILEQSSAPEKDKSSNGIPEDSIIKVEKILEQNSVPEKNIANNKNYKKNKTSKNAFPAETKPEIEKEEPTLSDEDVIVCDIIGRPSLVDEPVLSLQEKRLIERHERTKFLIKKKRTGGGITIDEKEELWDLTAVVFKPEPMGL